MIKVVKFGGSSVASAEQFKKVKSIIDSDSKRKAVVVSALGKRKKDDYKITDLLYLLSAHLRYGVDSSNVFNLIKDRYLEIQNELNINIDISKDFDELKEQIKGGVSEEFIVSRGEFMCAKLMARYLGYEFVDAKDVIYFKYNGSLDEEKTASAIKSAFDKYGKVVIPGFYGVYPTGEIKLFSRGGSDITGSIVAMALNAEVYENWTDVSGILVTDPKIVENPERIDEITYDELRELSYMGASVLHEDTIFPIRELNIPINILNTNKPQDKGTFIIKNSDKKDHIITGIAGKKNFKAFTLVKSMSSDKLAVIRGALNVFESFKVPVEHIPTSIDSFNVIVDGKAVENIVYDIISELKKIKGIISVDIDNDLALVAVVGRNMVLKPGISGTLFSVFGKHDINIKTIAQGTKEIDIIVGVSNADFEKSIRAIYGEIVLGDK